LILKTLLIIDEDDEEEKEKEKEKEDFVIRFIL